MPTPSTRPTRKAVIPVAGMGTRFLPATKAVPKELLPVVDRPALQYIVEEAARAGLGEVLMVTGRGKSAIEDFFDRQPELETALEKKGDAARLAAVHESTGIAQVHFVRQGEARGLGHAVLQAAAFVGDEPFAVLLGDDVVDARNPVLPRMLEIQQRFGGSVVLLLEVEPETISLYGSAAVEPTDEPDVMRVVEAVEKPEPADAPSNLAVIGRYVFSPAVFDVLRDTPPGRGGEIQVTDAINTLAQCGPEQGGPVHGLVFRGRRYDTGDRADYLRTVVTLASEREDLGPEFLQFLREFVAARS